MIDGTTRVRSRIKNFLSNRSDQLREQTIGGSTDIVRYGLLGPRLTRLGYDNLKNRSDVINVLVAGDWI